VGKHSEEVVEMFEAELKQAEPETVAYITMRGAYDQIPQGMGSLYGWVAQHGLHPTGAPRAVYLTPPSDAAAGTEAVWELWAPIADAVDAMPGPDGVGVKHIPEHVVATTMYHGPYEQIPPTYDALMEWVSGHGYTLVGPPEEIYYSDPNEVPPEEYLTEIRFPVAEVH
jgi:effector-binding domain-containing protein